MLALSTEAVPHLPLEDLGRVCDARGLDGIELVVPPGQDVDRLVSRAQGRVAALRVAILDDTNALAVARASCALAVSVSAGAVENLDRVVSIFEAAGGRLLLAHRTDLDDVLAALAAIRTFEGAALGLAWELESHRDASAVLFAAREYLGIVRLHGGGPEQRDQDGRGIGTVLGELAVSGYARPIVLCPSARDPATLARWARWAETRGSSGCGHAASTRELVLDVRDVEPRDRLETILGAYRSLIPGATLHLTVDHDPVCMYYTLEATEPPRSFEFQVVENGPAVWRADVTKR